MRAIMVREAGGPEVLKLEDVPDAVADDGRVLVRLEAAGVNHFDLSQRQNPAAMGTSLPYVPGVDGAGTRVDTGQRVLVTGALGTYAELVAAKAENVRPIPDTLDAAHAAALGVPYKTAWGSVTSAELQRGDSILVQAGSSATGQAVVDIARHVGAKVYATASASKHDRLRELGAEPLAYDDERISNLGVAVVYDPVGGDGFARSLAALAPGGCLVTPGAIDSPVVTFNLWQLIGKRARIIGSGPASVTSDDLDHIIELAGAGELRPVVDRELSLAEAAQAHSLAEHRQVFGKIILRP